MPPLRRAATTGGGGDMTSLGLQDAAASANGVYLLDDMMATLPMLSAAAGNGGYFYGYGTPAGVPTIPSGWTAALLQGHPGLATFTTQGLNDVGGFQIGTYNAVMQQPLSANLSWNGIVSVPQVLSTAADRYTWATGPLLASSTGPLNGWGIEYTDNVAGGAFRLMEYQSASMGPNTLATFGCSPVANGWYKVNITVKGTTVTASISGTGLGTQTYSVTASSVILTSNSNAAITFGLCGASMKRVTFTSGVHFAFVDRAELSIVGLGR